MKTNRCVRNNTKQNRRKQYSDLIGFLPNIIVTAKLLKAIGFNQSELLMKQTKQQLHCADLRGYIHSCHLCTEFQNKHVYHKNMHFKKVQSIVTSIL